MFLRKSTLNLKLKNLAVFLGASLLLTAAAWSADSTVVKAAPAAPVAPAQLGLFKALTTGKPSVAVRYRYEVYDMENPAFSASTASTLRLALGYETAPYYGFSLMGQFEGVNTLGADEYRVVNHRTQNLANHPVIADPRGTEVNQAFLKYSNPGMFGALVKLGRQDIFMNNGRFVSNSAWRQNNQTYDAGLFQAAPVKNLTVTYMHMLQFNRVAGKNASDGEMEMHSNIFNVVYKLPDFGAAYAYGLMLDYETLYEGNSSNTYGARIEGPFKVNPAINILYAAEYAKQDKTDDRPTPLDASYWLVEGGAAYKGLALKASYNVRSGSAADGQFNTPLSHPWDSWTELFLNTPVTGLKTLAISLGGPIAQVPGLSASVIYLDHSAESISQHYGSEIDFGAEYKVLPVDKNLTIGVRFADYMADKYSFDALRYSGYTAYSF